MKIGFLVGSVSREAGGLFQSVRGLAKAMMSRDATVTVFGISDAWSTIDLPEWQPLSVQAFPPQFRAWGYSNQLLPALLAADLDILSVHGLWKYCSVASSRWHQRTGRPYVVHPEGMLESWALRNERWKKRIASRLYENDHLRRASCLRALSEAEATSIRAYGVRNPVCVIPNGIDLPEQTNPEGDSHPYGELAKDRKILLYLGRLHPKKNLANLICAWKKLVSSRTSIREEWLLAIVGWGEDGYASELTDIAASEPVVFLGPKFGEEKSECFRACDAFILPSLSEGLPMTALEAWAYAKPVAMTPECNLSEGFSAGAAVRIGSTPEQIVSGLNQLTEMSDADRKAMGTHGRNLVANEFAWPRIGEQMRAVCDWMVGGGAVPANVRLR